MSQSVSLIELLLERMHALQQQQQQSDDVEIFIDCLKLNFNKLRDDKMRSNILAEELELKTLEARMQLSENNEVVSPYNSSLTKHMSQYTTPKHVRDFEDVMDHYDIEDLITLDEIDRNLEYSSRLNPALAKHLRSHLAADPRLVDNEQFFEDPELPEDFENPEDPEHLEDLEDLEDPEDPENPEGPEDPVEQQ